MSRIARHLLAGLVISLAASAPRATAADASPPQTIGPNKEQLLAQAQQCRELLRTSLIQFYLPACVDQANGGYLESLRGGKFALTGEKFLTLQARQLWFFSTLAIEGYETERALAAARSGFSFIQTKMRDAQNGGYYSKVTDEGGPRDPRKHAYLNSFALYGLTAYYRATKAPRLCRPPRNFPGPGSQITRQEAWGLRGILRADWTRSPTPRRRATLAPLDTRPTTLTCTC